MSNPSLSTIKHLFAISKNRCAFPDCSHLLIDINGTVVGEVCHIKGRKPGAARYDAAQTEEERHAFDNLILMCPNHHTIIDSDENFYTVEMLLDFKAKHVSSTSTENQISDDIGIQFINNIILNNPPAPRTQLAKSELERLQDKIRERTDILHELSERALSPNAPPSIVSWIADVKSDLSRLKQQVNSTAPGTYSDFEATPPINFYNKPQESYFTGREEFVSKILKGLDPEERTWVVSIDGLGGIGKTSLAAEAAYRCSQGEGTFEEIIWTTAQQQRLSPGGILNITQYLIELDDFLDEICRAFNYSTPEDFSFDEKLRTVKGLLRQRRCLLVVDNLETLYDPKPIASFLRETPHPTKTIVTSRRLFQVGEGERFVRLPPLTRQEGLSLIEYEQSKKELALSESQALSLFDLCNGIPMALNWSIGKMVFSSPEIVLNDLKGLRNVEDLTGFCFQSAFETLRNQHDEAAKVFLILSLFPFPIEIEVIREVAQIHNPANFNAIIEELNLLSLIKLDNNLINSLPLVRDYAKHKLGRAISLENEARVRLAKHISNRNGNEFIHVFTPTNELITLPREATPVDFAYKIHTNIGNKYVSATINGFEVDPTRPLKDGDQIAIVAHPASNGPTPEMVRTQRAIRCIRNRNRAVYRLVQPVRRGNTFSRDGLLSQSLKEYDLAVTQEPGYIWAHSRRGHVLRLLGELNQAIEEYQTVLLFAPDDPFAYCGIAATNYQRGWLDKAVEYYQKALNSKPDYVNALNGLGRIYCRQRDFKVAEKYFKEALGASIQIKTQTPWLHLNLSIALLNQGMALFKEADTGLSESLRQFSKKTGHSRKAHVGTHTFYHYSIALILANSPKHEEIFKTAIQWCSAKGLRDEIIADLGMINAEAWGVWSDYAVKKTSQVPLRVKPEDLIDSLQSLGY